MSRIFVHESSSYAGVPLTTAGASISSQRGGFMCGGGVVGAGTGRLARTKDVGAEPLRVQIAQVRILVDLSLQVMHTRQAEDVQRILHKWSCQ